MVTTPVIRASSTCRGTVLFVDTLGHRERLMVTTTPTHIAEVAMILAADVKLTAAQRTKIKTEVTTDPKARGYAGMAQADLCIALAMPYQILNPNAQGTVTVRTPDYGLRKLFKVGKITQQELIGAETETYPDPDWQPYVDRQSRLDAVLNTTGAVISISELQAALA